MVNFTVVKNKRSLEAMATWVRWLTWLFYDNTQTNQVTRPWETLVFNSKLLHDQRVVFELVEIDGHLPMVI
jgi:hypothetical protein